MVFTETSIMLFRPSGIWLRAIMLCLFSSFSFHFIVGQIETARDNHVAFVYPVENIVIDGNADDWPEDLPSYVIEDIPYGNAPADKADFHAEFRVAYNQENQNLYVVVTVEDDVQKINRTEESVWNNQDTHNFYLDPNYSQKGSGLTLYSYNSFLKEIADATTSWDPAVRNKNWDNVKVSTSTVGTQTIYEWQIHLGEYCRPGRTIGIDHVMIDQDEEDANTFVAWNEGGGKSRSFGRIGQAILLPHRDAPLGTVDGYLQWRDSSVEQETPKRIVISSQENPELWTLIKINKEGYYAQKLPVGNYDIGLFWGYDEGMRTDHENDRVQVEIFPDQVVRAPNLMVSNLPKPEVTTDEGWILKENVSTKEVDEFVDKYMKYYDIPGVSLALIKEDDVSYHKTYGVENTFTGEEVDGSTLFEAASITKPVFAFAVCRLAERGLIDLDKPLYQYLPFEDIAHDERYQLITAKHVLSHRTGFPNWGWMNEDGKVDIKFTPGTDYGYSGEGFEYLKRVVVHITGKDILDILEEEVLGPLGLQNIYFMEDPELAKKAAFGHWDNRPGRANLPEAPGMAWSMYTEAKEFTKFLIGVKNRIGLTPNMYQQMFAKNSILDPNPEEPEVQEYFGLGMWFADTPAGRVFGHGGNNGDFKCRAYYFEDLDFGLTIFTNANTGDFLIDDLIDFLISGKRETNAEVEGE